MACSSGSTRRRSACAISSSSQRERKRIGARSSPSASGARGRSISSRPSSSAKRLSRIDSSAGSMRLEELPAPRCEVGSRRRPERSEVPLHEVHECVGDRRPAEARSPKPHAAGEAPLGRVRQRLERDQMPKPRQVAEVLDLAGRPAALFEERDELACRPRLTANVRPDRRDELRRGLRAAVRPRRDLLAQGGRVERVVPRADEVERPAHQRALDDLPAPERPRQVRSLESLEPRPERDVRRGNPLRLERGDPLDRPGRARAVRGAGAAGGGAAFD